MKYKIITLILILFTQSVYSQNEFRIYVGHSTQEDHEDYLEGINGNVVKIHDYTVVTIDLNENQIQVFEILTEVNPTPSDITPNKPIINNDEILSFEYTINGENIDFKFEKSKNIITLTRQSFRWDGTKNPIGGREFYNGFTRQQLDNPTNELEIKYSEFFKPVFKREEFYEKLEHPWGNKPSHQLERKGYFNRDSVEKVIYLYNSELVLDWTYYRKYVSDTPTLKKKTFERRQNLISYIESPSKWNVEVDIIPVDLLKILGNSKPTMNIRFGKNLSELQNGQKIVLEYHYHPKSGKGDIGYYSSTKSWLESFTNWSIEGSGSKILGEDLEFEYNVFKKLYKIRRGIDKYDEYRINSDVVVDTNVVVRTTEEVIDTVGWTRRSEPEILIVMKKKKQFDRVSKEEYEKKKSKYLKKGYKVFGLFSFKNSPYNPRNYPGYSDRDDTDRVLWIRKKKSVWLNDVYIGTCLFHEKLNRNELFN